MHGVSRRRDLCGRQSSHKSCTPVPGRSNFYHHMRRSQPVSHIVIPSSSVSRPQFVVVFRIIVLPRVLEPSTQQTSGFILPDDDPATTTHPPACLPAQRCDRGLCVTMGTRAICTSMKVGGSGVSTRHRMKGLVCKKHLEGAHRSSGQSRGGGEKVLQKSDKGGWRSCEWQASKSTLLGGSPGTSTLDAYRARTAAFMCCGGCILACNPSVLWPVKNPRAVGRCD